MAGNRIDSVWIRGEIDSVVIGLELSATLMTSWLGLSIFPNGY